MAKGYRLKRSKLFRYAKDAVWHGLQYSYRDRKTKKRNFRALWQIRINAATRAAGLSYSRFIEGLKAASIKVIVPASRSPSNMITLKNVSRAYGAGDKSVAAVRDVSVDIAPGAFVTIVGASGSGKSTLLHLMGALDRPTDGQVLLEGKDLGTMSDEGRTLTRRDRIGFVFQFFNLLPTLTAAENVALPARLAGGAGRASRSRAVELLTKVGLGGRTEHRPGVDSGVRRAHHRDRRGDR